MLRDKWELYDHFRVSDIVCMVEADVIGRLARDTGMKWIVEAGMKFQFLMRRHTAVRMQFAQAVGKRLLCQKIVVTQRAQLVEHHRTAHWSELEYAALLQLMFQKAHELRQVLQKDEDYHVCDYVQMVPDGSGTKLLKLHNEINDDAMQWLHAWEKHTQHLVSSDTNLVENTNSDNPNENDAAGLQALGKAGSVGLLPNAAKPFRAASDAFAKFTR